MAEHIHIAFEDPFSLVGRRHRRCPDDSLAGDRGFRHSSSSVLSKRAAFGHEIFRPFHLHELGSQVQHQRRFEFARVFEFGVRFQDVGDIDLIEIVDGFCGWPRRGHQECLEVRLESMRGNENEVLHSEILPALEQFIHHTMEGLSPQSRRPKRTSVDGDAVRERRRPEDSTPFGDFTRDALGDEGVRSDREVGTVLLESAYRKYEPGVCLENSRHFGPRQFVDRV